MSRRVLFRTGTAEALTEAERSLSRAGLSVLRSFEKNGLPSTACDCAAAGCGDCSCRFAVLLVFDRAGPPAVVTAAGRDGRFVLEVASDPNTRIDPGLILRTERALLSAPGAEGVAPPDIPGGLPAPPMTSSRKRG